MAYVHGASQQRDPRLVMQTLARNIAAAKEQLAWLDEQVAAATKELLATQRKAAKARREHTAYMRDRATDPDRIKADAQRAYDLAMALHPDNALKGRRRRRILEQEVAAASRDHQEQDRAA